MSERLDRVAVLLDHLSDDLTSVHLADAEAVRRRGRERSRNQALGTALTAVLAVVVVLGGAGLLRPDDKDRSAPPATQSPTATSRPTTAPPTRAVLLTPAQISTALDGCCGAVHASQPSVGASRCLSSALTSQSSPVPSRSVAVAGGAGLVVTETAYAADPAAVTELLTGVYAVCLGTAGNKATFDRAAPRVPGGHVVGVTFAGGGADGIAQEYAGWAPVGTGALLVQIAFTGNADLGPDQVENVLAAAATTATG